VELLEQNKKVEVATRAKSDFLASMSHELRTPLNGILGFVEVLLDGVVGEPVPAHREYLQDVLASGRHLLRLINDVLDLVKVESGKMDVLVERVELEPLLQDTVEIVRTQAGRKKIKVSVEGHPDVREVVVDPARFKQIVYNYLSNAVKFTPVGGRVTVRVRPDGSDSYRVDVEDTGRGIRPEDLQRLFVAFQQLDGDRQQGTGLGLALTRQLVELQQGRVEVASEVGKGSTFSVILPRVVRPGGVASLVPAPAVSRTNGHIPRGLLEGVCVLLIDGHAVSLKLMEIILRAQGCVVHSASSGASALAAWDELRPQVVLMEVRLPDVSGYELLPVLRQADPPPQAIVAVTAAVMKDELAAVRAAGFDGLLAKPIEPRLFPSQVKALLQGDARAG
ncbi:MAG TPA: ATP-binding protein, partial [Candidatus Xenobia bacterium]|jgi:CheY-like chemotaxis protein